jgi:hypothetical protein
MEPQTDLKILLNSMQPILHDQQYVIFHMEDQSTPVLPFDPLGMFKEMEGWTVYARKTDTDHAGISCTQAWACITLMVYSSLEAVGFLAEISRRLAEANIPVNVISAYHHDHLLVPWFLKDAAMRILSSIVDSNA